MIESIKVRDVTTFDGWCSTENIKDKRCRMITIVGRVIFEDTEQITVALMSSDEEPPEIFASFVMLPKGAVVERENL